MTHATRRILVGAVFFGVTCVVAVSGYMLAGWRFLDAIYMVVITVFGVGYGEAKPLESPELKIFTMGVIIAGCSSGIYVVGGFVSMLADGEINRALGTRRMTNDINKLTAHTIICGFGRVGQMIAGDLAAAHSPFVVIDSDERRSAEAKAAGYLCLLGSASDEPTLEAAGISRARVLATVLPDDTANVFITLTARDLNPTLEIIGRAESPSTKKKLMRSGATRVVLPTLIGANKISQLILRPTAEDLLMDTAGQMYLNDELKQIGIELTAIELAEGSPLVGQAIENIEISGGGFLIVAVKRRDGSLVRSPKPGLELGAGDAFLVLGHADSVPQLARRAKARQAVSYRGLSS